jgi:hypothetical protein
MSSAAAFFALAAASGFDPADRADARRRQRSICCKGRSIGRVAIFLIWTTKRLGPLQDGSGFPALSRIMSASLIVC